MATLKIEVTPAVFAALFDAIEKKDPALTISHQKTNAPGCYPAATMIEQSFVSISPGTRKFDGNYIEATLELMEERRETLDRDRSRDVPITRDKLDALFDILKLFPLQDFDRARVLGISMRALEAMREIERMAAPIMARIEGLHPASQVVESGALLLFMNLVETKFNELKQHIEQTQ